MAYGFNVTSHRRVIHDGYLSTISASSRLTQFPIIGNLSHLVGARAVVQTASTAGNITVAIRRFSGGTATTIATITIPQDETFGEVTPTDMARGGVDPNVLKDGDAIWAEIGDAGTGASNICVTIVEHIDSDKSS